MNSSLWFDARWAIPVWLVGVAALVGAAIYARRYPDSKSGRAFLFLFPKLHPNPKRASVAPWAAWLVLITVFILVLNEWFEWF